MTIQDRRCFLGTVGALAVGGATVLQPSAARADDGSVRIGVVKSIFQGYPAPFIDLITKPLIVLMKSQTGLSGTVELVEDGPTLGKMLKANQVQLGVFQGVELGWAQLETPTLKPLLVAVRDKLELRSCLVVSKDCEAGNCGGLEGKTLTLDRKSRLHVRLFLERRCPGPAVDPQKFFSSVKESSTPSKALDEVVKGNFDAAVVDESELETYALKKRSRHAKLKILHWSEVFPVGVIAYHPDHFGGARLQRVRQGLGTAHKNARGRQMLQLSKIESFRAVPTNFDDQVRAIVKAYPLKVK